MSKESFFATHKYSKGLRKASKERKTNVFSEFMPHFSCLQINKFKRGDTRDKL